MSFYNNKVTKDRMCFNDANEKKELMHSFGKFSKYFQCDKYYTNLNLKGSTPEMSSKMGCYNGSLPKSMVLTSSEFLQNRASRNVMDKPHSGVCSREHNSSDRSNLSNTTLNIPSRGNSLNRTLTSNRPGAQSAPGTGVDIKHNSYFRHIMLMRGKVLNKEGC
jgi:hypothetical protein